MLTVLVLRLTVVQAVTPMEALVRPVISVLEMVGVEEMEIQGLEVQAEFLLEAVAAAAAMVFPQAQVAQAVEAR